MNMLPTERKATPANADSSYPYASCGYHFPYLASSLRREQIKI